MTERKVQIVIAATDNELLSKQLMLQGEGGIEILGATDNGAEVCNMLTQKTPDVLLIDVFLTNVDGLEVVELIRENEQFSNIKIIFLSTVGSPRIISMAFNLGADYYI